MRRVVLAYVTCIAAACTPDIPDDELARGARLPDRTQDGDAASGDDPFLTRFDAGTGTPNNGPPPPNGVVDGGGGGVDSGPVSNPPPAPTPPCGQLGIQINTITRGQAVASCDNRFLLAMQNDGNLVLYKVGVAPLWHTQTNGTTAERAVMQGDGNFVLYNAASQPLFHTSTFNHPGATLAVQNDGNLVVYATGGQPLWNSGTSGH